MDLTSLFGKLGNPSKEPRFGLIFERNKAENNALIVINNRDHTFNNVEVLIVSKQNEVFKKILKLQNREAALIRMEEFSQKTNLVLSENVSKVIIQHEKCKLSFVPDGNTFKLTSH